MSPPRRSCIFPGCHSVQSNGAVSLFKFCTDNNLSVLSRGATVDQNRHQHPSLQCRFTPDSYSNYHQVKSGFLKSLLMLVSGAEPTLSIPSLHPPVPQTAGATITTAGIMCPPPALDGEGLKLLHSWYYPSH